MVIKINKLNVLNTWVSVDTQMRGLLILKMNIFEWLIALSNRICLLINQVTLCHFFRAGAQPSNLIRGYRF